MGEKALVEGLILDTFELVKCLDRSSKAPSLVVWYFYEDADEWRLLLAGREFDKNLPKNETLSYRTISEAIASSNIQSLSISHIKIVESNSVLPNAIKLIIATPLDALLQANFSNTTLNGIFIKDMIVMRSAKENA